MLSRPEYRDEEICELKTIIIDFPTRTANQLRTEQLKDLELKKIIDCFENPNKGVDFANWTGRGYVMNQGVLYRYSPHAEVEEAQLVVPTHEREKILKLHHDAPTAAHYGADGTFSRISSKYYWTGMRKFIADYVKSCSECIRYKATNQKPAGLLQTPVPAQRFESIAIDLFGPLPETTEGMKWIFIVEDYTTKWVELFPLKQATAKECAMTLLNEVFLRYGVPRRLISDNGTQFVSAVMQQLCFVLDINQSLIPVYHPQANPVERKNRDLKPRLAMMVGNNHTLWIEKLPAIRFALNTSKCESTDHTAAYLTFARELRTLDQVNTDLRSVIHNDNFVPEFTPYLKRFEGYMSQIKENIEMSQDRQKTYADKSRRPSPNYKVNDLVWVKLHPLSKASQNRSAKLMPRRDGPYIVLSQRSPTTFVVASCDKPDEPLGVYHTSALTPFLNGTETQSPVVPLKKRGRPRKQPLVPRGTAGENAIMSASTPPRRDGLRRSNVIKELEENMNMIEQIDGYLKIARSFPLVSLNFLKSLTTIRGEQLDKKNYALLILDNQNLQELWDWQNRKSKLKILNGKIFFHFNSKLCPSKIQELKKYAETVDWDDRDVSPSSNGDRVACDVTNMNVTVQSLTPSVVRVKWESFHKQLYDERSLLGYVIYYREA
ncbi:insulin receptor [Trichonephila clavipes]|nr:insulin receptor [Trichonephila clavipes]